LLSAAILVQGTKAGALENLIGVRIDTAEILIGEQTTLYLTVTTDRGKTVYWPFSADTLMTGVEVLSTSDPDTVDLGNNRVEIRQNILITSFDSALYLLPPFMVIDDRDTAYSEQVALKVSTLPVSTEAPNEFFDIKDIWKPAFVWADYYPVILTVLLCLILAAAIIYIVKRLKSRKSIIPFKKAEPPLPPHEEAVRRLDLIRQHKLWQQGKNKEYHTQITDTLRYYIFRRYGVNAMEMTSKEVLDALKHREETPSACETLRQILSLADFVKFAKLHPLPDENDLTLKNAYLYVSLTKQVEFIKPSEDSLTQQIAADETNISNSGGGETV
jgi:hypothetical protein